ncbi:P-loop containing nucleoside triphosphate hydrolase protein [Obba rivulosa]|uniref:P-loop containing nucleoside triphosphate hydrolase protein n=1 Tax=Obba rivulosa TaxID=1052685 RepID=A0A8E2ALD5_9APHY|nr:P-loop containing nucleoside triphosphate hydrolase protein [Obba rivulosa]
MNRILSLKRASTSGVRSPLPQEVQEKAGPSGSSSGDTETASTHNGDGEDETGSTAALVSAPAALPPPTLKVKRVDHYWSNWSKAWKYRNTSSKVTPEMMTAFGGSSDSSDPWLSFCFVVVRKMPQNMDEGQEPTFQIVVKSPYLVKACKDVIGDVPGLSWTQDPLQVDPQLFISFLPHFEEYQKNLLSKRDRSAEEEHVLSTVGVLISYIRTDYRGTVARVANLTSHGEITFDLLHAIFVPRTVVVTECPTTGEPRALQLVSANRVQTMSGAFYDIICESVDAVDANDSSYDYNNVGSVDSEVQKAGAGKAYGKVQSRMIIPSFKGTMKISALDVFPLKYHPAEAELRKVLLARGKKWLSLRGIHHMQYKATAVQQVLVGSCKKLVRYNINSRIMVDRGIILCIYVPVDCVLIQVAVNFRRLNPNYDLPTVKGEANAGMNTMEYDTNGNPISDPNRNVPTLRVQGKTQTEVTEITEDELILASPIVYGFSLSDKLWLEFNVKHIQPITWNDEAFTNLVLPPGRKALLQSLVEAHNSDLGFDDFVQGKGHGLVINLYGPPGVGKTLSAEATSEHVRRPLYVVGGGDLGTYAGELDQRLQEVFDIATSWKAIVLIDEADVFLEQRSLHDMERNAMVAVFLRHVEYYRGILFMTTNRVKAFDEAFLSRIHVALHFRDLSKDAKAQVWRAFLAKVDAVLADDLVEKLADREINGRQIKNATRTANSLAVSRGEKLEFQHLVETLDAMDEFTADFASTGKDAVA